MRIVIDAIQSSPHITGTDRMASNILRELQSMDATNHYTILVNEKYNFIGNSVVAKNFKTIKVSAKHRAIWLQLNLPLVLLKNRADAFYSFHNFSSPGLRVCKTVVSILDTIPLTRTEYFYGNESYLRKFIVNRIMRRSLKVADKFIAISEFTKKSAVEELNINEDKIRVMHLQADPAFFEVHSRESIKKVIEKYNLPKQFIFSMGANEPRKNIVSLVKAHRKLPASLRTKFPLLIAGANWKNASMPIKDDPFIRMTGFIEDEHLPVVYSLSDLFVFPSVYEGFGLPILEAMASGSPVMTTRFTSIPEVAGDAAFYIDPDNLDEFGLSLEKVLEKPKMRHKMALEGQRRAKDFSWNNAAKILMETLNEASD